MLLAVVTLVEARRIRVNLQAQMENHCENKQKQVRKRNRTERKCEALNFPPCHVPYPYEYAAFPTKPSAMWITELCRLDPARNSSTMVRLRSCRCCLSTLGDSMRFCNMLVTEWYEGVMIAISPWIPNIITDQKAWPRSLVASFDAKQNTKKVDCHRSCCLAGRCEWAQA